ncbi:putative spermidine/putrescine transport system permease protein [Pricia antarctica]|uniref:Putative spermidine/putrescine transport system permease protein n=1 Tax=Pricia antarctica TaxID=641691 RepID=A0A1G6WZA1_9FLAO|nr:ABC transporter permease subunit [Pricia antarctica]SDD71171.1 putative spermidine/putrescine transport system permease protein [Pricia antarctica]
MKNKRLNFGIILFIAIGVVPFVAAFIYALLYSFGVIGVANKGFTTEFWTSVLASGEFFTSFLYSFLIALVAVAVSVGGALWVTLKFRKRLEQKFLSFIIYLPLAVPGIVTGFFTFQLFSKGGFFARLSYQLGWITEASQFPDLVNDALAFGILLSFITMIMPFFVLLFLNVYKNERIEELSILAQSLGANAKQVTQRISLPILIKKTRVLIVLYFIFLLGAYEVPLILGRESPQMLSVLIIREIKQYDLDKISEGYVVAVMYTLIVSAAAIVLFFPRKGRMYEH